LRLPKFCGHLLKTASSGGLCATLLAYSLLLDNEVAQLGSSSLVV